jgi:hypothetical protein
MRAREVVVLMAGAAMDGCGAIAVWPALHIHDVPMQIISLARITAC